MARINSMRARFPRLRPVHPEQDRASAGIRAPCRWRRCSASRTPRGIQPLRIGLRFVAQRIVFGGDDQRRRQTGEAFGKYWRNARISRIASVAAISPVIPGQILARHQAFGGGHGDGWERQREVDHRLQQHLVADRDAWVGSKAQARGRSQIPSRTFAAHDDGARCAAQPGCMCPRPEKWPPRHHRVRQGKDVQVPDGNRPTAPCAA